MQEWQQYLFVKQWQQVMLERKVRKLVTF